MRLSFIPLLLVGIWSGEGRLPDSVQPVVGILSIPPNASSDLTSNNSQIDASYVKFLEGAGAVVEPILFNSTLVDIEAQFRRLSGVLFTGGPSKPTDFTRYFATATTLYNLALETNQPLWGTCLGFQTISDIVGGGTDILSDFNSVDLELPLLLNDGAETSRFLSQLPAYAFEGLTENNFTTNWHSYGISPEIFDSLLSDSFRPISYDYDREGAPFVSSMEHKSSQIYAVQWHPEANQYDRDHTCVNHGIEAASVMQAVANFYVNQTREYGLGCGDYVSNSRLIDSYPRSARGERYLFF